MKAWAQQQNKANAPSWCARAVRSIATAFYCYGDVECWLIHAGNEIGSGTGFEYVEEGKTVYARFRSIGCRERNTIAVRSFDLTAWGIP